MTELVIMYFIAVCVGGLLDVEFRWLLNYHFTVFRLLYKLEHTKWHLDLSLLFHLVNKFSI